MSQARLQLPRMRLQWPSLWLLQLFSSWRADPCASCWSCPQTDGASASIAACSATPGSLTIASCSHHRFGLSKRCRPQSTQRHSWQLHQQCWLSDWNWTWRPRLGCWTKSCCCHPSLNQCWCRNRQRPLARTPRQCSRNTPHSRHLLCQSRGIVPTRRFCRSLISFWSFDCRCRCGLQ